MLILRPTILTGLIAFFLSSPVLADGFRCPRTGRLVNDGDTTFEVRSKCGEPSGQEWIRGRRRMFDERWSYDFGPQNLIRILWFRQGRLVEVDVGEYGSSETMRL